MEVRENQACFVCGLDNPVGLRARFTADTESHCSFCRLSIPEAYQGWQEVVHGGIISALLDEAAVYACREGNEALVTAELAVRFRRPVHVGKEIEVTGEVVEARRNTFRVQCRLAVDGAVHAEAEARIVRL